MSKIIPFRPPRPPRSNLESGIWNLEFGRAGGRNLQSSIGSGYNDPSVSTQIEIIAQEGEPFLVGDWLVEPSLNRISRAGEAIQLELKAMDVLLCLVAHAGEVVPQTELLDAVWQTEFVSDNTVKSRVAELRSALGDDARDPRYIETIRKRGYRLIAEVRPFAESAGGSSSVPEATLPADTENNPYPGLAAFTEADADRFFGREAEAAALWRRISARRLLAVIGPSGVGKSSLLRAGVAARAPPGWRVVVFTPGEAPTLSLARALASDHAGDPAAMARLLGFNDSDTALAVVSRWRGQFDEVVLVVDQFEELFTLNPPEVQSSFIEMLRRLVDAADVHVVLAMRDDFLHHCQRYPQIAPICEALTLLGPPSAEGLRRALKEPAARQFYRFSTELLVDRMIAEVEGERGALPLMAFAVHRLWEERDREGRLLTEEAYEGIGGVAGALALHADATLERIGAERLPIVRELFRNLVTAEETRAVREVDELLSVFQEDQRNSAEEVLRKLVDARLLTSYKHDDEEGSLRRVEIIHESLLTSWPRLVRWQTQDADSVRLRDGLRQAARTWDEHERAHDYLWTGKAYREFSVWRENYPGGLTDLEEEFAAASTPHARQRTRRRRLAASALVAVATAVAAIFGVLWRQGVLEKRRAEAQKLVALGQLRLEDYPTATLAHAIASLELSDTPQARRLALRSLWEGPTAFVVNSEPSRGVAFTPDGTGLVQSIQDPSRRQLGIVGSDGSSTALDRIFDSDRVYMAMNPRAGVLFSEPELPVGSPQAVVLWSIPGGRQLADVRIAPPALVDGRVIGWSRNRCLALVQQYDRVTIHAFNFDGTHEGLGALDLGESVAGWTRRVAINQYPARWVASVEDETIWLQEIGERGLSERLALGRHEGANQRVALDPEASSSPPRMTKA